MILTIDQGGQGTKVSVYHQGRSIAEAFRAVHTSFPAPLFAEQNPTEVLQSIFDCFAALQKIDTFPIKQIALATQRSSNLCWNLDTGNALTPIISWQDRRTESDIQAYLPQQTLIRKRTGLRLSPHYGATKFHYCLQHFPAVQDALRQEQLAWGPLSSFLIFQLTQERTFACDPVNASRTLLYNPFLQDWDEELLQLFQLPRKALPAIYPNDACFGHLRWQERLVPLMLVEGDQPAALFAHGAPNPKACYINIGTGAFLQRPISQADALRLSTKSLIFLSGLALQKKNGETLFCLEGTLNGAAAALHWAADYLQLDAKEMERIKTNWQFPRAIPQLFLNGIGGLGSPFWQADFTSQWIAVTPAVPKLKSESIFAVLDSILFLIQANLIQMEELQPDMQTLYVSGGLSQMDKLCQALSNLSQRNLIRRNNPQATSAGLARLCELEVESDPNALEENCDFHPTSDGQVEQEQWRHWMEEIRRAINEQKPRVS